MIINDELALIPERFLKFGRPEYLTKGTTCKVYEMVTQSNFILKVIECGNDNTKLELALKEVEILKKLSSCRNIVKMIDSDVVRSAQGWIVYILQERLTPIGDFYRNNVLTEFQIANFGINMAEALIQCKNSGIMHLDIQPKNLYVAANGIIKIGDFGSSVFLEELKTDNRLRGTKAYMAPEVYRERKYGIASEIYSIGLVLFCLINKGNLPFVDKYNGEMAVNARLAGEAFIEDSASGLLKTVKKACEYKPENRYSSYEEFISALKRFVQLDTAMSEPPFPIPQRPRTMPSVSEYRSAATAPDSNGAKSWFPKQPLSGQKGLPEGAGQVKGLSRLAGIRALKTTQPVAKAPQMPERKVTFDADAFCETTILSPFFDESSAQKGQAVESMSTCRFCGEIISVNQKFCSNCGTKLLIEAPRISLDNVQFSAVVPKDFIKDEYSFVELYMYEEEYRRVVDKALSEMPKGKEITSGFLEIEKKTRVTVKLSSPDIAIDEDCNEQTWIGKYLKFDFSVTVPSDYAKKQILFIATVYFNGVIATRLKFAVEAKTAFEQKISILREDVISAFISYASQDRGRVATIIQGMKKARPEMDIFFDVESLRSGEDWKKALCREIERRDILYLCWSHFAKASQWVDWEWKYALEHKGIECIEPIPIESPDVCPPPTELESKHFNDKILLYQKNESGYNDCPKTEKVKSPYLVRVKNNDIIPLKKMIFRVGTEKGYVDYPIVDNRRVSRSHANFISRDNDVYVVDTNSTNHIYVDGVYIEPNKEIKLSDKSEVMLADEKFIFYMGS